jgi:hypothetical protein
MDYVLDHFEARNRLAEEVIASYAAGHAALDVGIGIAGIIVGTFVPFGGTAAMVASLAAQAPLIYQPMVQDLAKIYCASSDDFTQKVVNKATILGAAGDIGSEIVREFLVSEFGQEFLLEIIHELIPELGIGGILGAVPIIGGFVAAGVDVLLAATLTWRVGKTTALYFFNGQQWPGGSKKSAYDLAKKGKGGGLSAATNRPGTIDEELLREDPAMWEKNVKGMIQIIRSMKKVDPSLSNSKIRSLLREEGYPEGVLEEALRRV